MTDTTALADRMNERDKVLQHRPYTKNLPPYHPANRNPYHPIWSDPYHKVWRR